MDPFQTFGYVRASTDPRIESPEVQRRLIEQYCRRTGLKLNGIYVDPGDSAKQPLFRREAGGTLAQHLRPGDHVVLARFDGLAGSFIGCVVVLETWFKQGVTTHIFETPAIRLDANSLLSRMVIEALVLFTQASRRRIGIQVRESFFHLAQEHRRCSRHAPFGFRWQKRGGKTYTVPVAAEQVVVRRVVELKLQGYSFDQIRQYLAYEWRVRNRENREFGYSEIRNMVIRHIQESIEARAPVLSLGSPADN